MIEFTIPEIGENIESGNVVEITVAVGDTVKKDQPLLTFETDKATLEIPSPCDGTIKEIFIKEGEDVKIGGVVMKIDDADTSTPAVTASGSKAETPAKEEHPKEETKAAPAQPDVATPPARHKSPGDIPAAPSVRLLAREAGIDISLVSGTGPGGRISSDDVKAYIKQTSTSKAGPSVPPSPVGVPPRPLPDFAKWGDIERKEMNNVRKKTVSHLSYCWSTIPHVTQFDKADITELEKLRKRYSSDKRKLTVTPFLLKVLAAALKTFPQFNASIDPSTQEIIYKKYFHVGVAVDTDRGLLVPVIRDVDKKSIYELTDELQEAAHRARDRKTSIEELQGGSITLTNLGGIGGTAFTPIINWPEVAILGVSRADWEPCYANNICSPRFMLPLALSYDHRLIDGADGARFLRWVADAIQQPFIMELGKQD